VKQHHISLTDADALRSHRRLYVTLADWLAASKMFNVEVRRQINQYTSCDQGRDLADIQLGKPRDGGDVLTAVTVVKLTIFTKVAQTINLRACAQPHLYQIIICAGWPAILV
jgi:hypothetical protein